MRRPITSRLVHSTLFALALVVLVWLGLAGTRPAQAEGVVTTCDETSLRAALAGGGSVTFNCGPTPPLTLTSPLVITTATSLDGSNGGNPVTLSGNNATRLFSISLAVALTLTDLTLSDGYAGADAGGAVYVNSGGTLVLDHSTIQNSHTAGFPGSAVFAAGGTVTLQNHSVVQNNFGADDAAIHSTGEVNVLDSVLRNNTATTGAGALSVSGAVLISNSQILSNSATPGDGGGIQALIGSHVTIVNSQFYNNTAYGGGGAIINKGVLSVTQTSFISNSASGGGSVYNYGTATLLNSTLSGNTVTGLFASGGGLGNSGTVTLLNSTLSGNHAIGDFAYGGGLSNFGTLTLLNSTVSDNTAAYDGGGLSNYGTATLLNSTLSTNTAGYGGGLSNSAVASLTNAEATLANVTLSANSAITVGGAILNRATAKLLNVTLSNNSAPQGGALFMVSGYTTVLTNTILAYSPSGGNCNGTLSASKFTLSSDFTCALPVTQTIKGNDPNGLDPLLEGLTNNGGPTTGVGHDPLLTHMLKADSPARDGIVGSDAPTTDERGVLRPQGSGYDLGAVEYAALANLTVSSSGAALAGSPAYFTATLTAGDGAQYAWNFGDGVMTSALPSAPALPTGGPTASHTYAQPGAYTVVVTATNAINSLSAATHISVSGALYLPLIVR